jgi:molybdopterin converting factor small subunit
MDKNAGMARFQVQLRYWAGARHAAGVETDSYSTSTIGQALEQARAHHDERFASVLAMSSLLHEGTVIVDADLWRPLEGAVEIEVLPPFAGGSQYLTSSLGS